MNKRFALTLYLAVWAGISAGVIFGITRAGYPLWAAVSIAYLLFMILNGSLAYIFFARRRRLEGNEVPSYLRYIFLGSGTRKYKEGADRFTHLLVGVAAALLGAFLVFCGGALAMRVDWARMPHPFIGTAMCLVLAGIGVAFLYVAWRCFASALRRTSHEVT
jgi:hypothetical protein